MHSVLFYYKITLHVSGVFHTHNQEYIKLQLQPSVQVIMSVRLPPSNVSRLGTWPCWMMGVEDTRNM